MRVHYYYNVHARLLVEKMRRRSLIKFKVHHLCACAWYSAKWRVGHHFQIPYLDPHDTILAIACTNVMILHLVCWP